MKRITVSVLNSSSGIPAWELFDGDRYLGHAIPRVFSPILPSTPSFTTGNGLAVYLSVHPIELTDTSSFDYAVPMNSDGTYPCDGEACTVYESEDFDNGIVPLWRIREKAGENITAAIQEYYLNL